MRAFKSVLDPKAIRDIQEAIDYYDEQEIGLEEIFEETVHQHIIKLEQIPFFQERYDSVPCLPIQNFLICFTTPLTKKVNSSQFMV